MKPKSAITKIHSGSKASLKKPLKNIAIEMAEKHFESIILTLKNCEGVKSRDLSRKEVIALPEITTIKAFIGNIGEKLGIASSSANNNSKITAYLFEAPAYPLFSLEQNDEGLSFFEANNQLYKLDSYKIYQPKDLDVLCLYLSLKN